MQLTLYEGGKVFCRTDVPQEALLTEFRMLEKLEATNPHMVSIKGKDNLIVLSRTDRLMFASQYL